MSLESPTKPIIEVNHIYKYYGEICALNDISFSVKPHRIFGIIGEDGAGKSTLFRILTTLLLPDKKREDFQSESRAKSGAKLLLKSKLKSKKLSEDSESKLKANKNVKKDSIATQKCENHAPKGLIAGFDMIKDYAKIRRIIGYMPNNFSLYMDLSVEENLAFFADIFGVSVEENYDLIAPIFNALKPFKMRKASALSGGMKQKLALSCALIHKPKILFLDEPTTGVDALSRMEFWEILSQLKTSMTILVSTPYMDEARLCDEIAFIAQGKFLSISTPKKLISSFQNQLYQLKNVPISALESIRTLPQVRSCFLFGNSYHITLKNNRAGADISADSIADSAIDEALHSRILDDFITALEDSLNIKNATIRAISPNIEDCFMELLI